MMVSGAADPLLVTLAFLYLAWLGKPGEERAVLTAKRQLLLDRDKLLGELLAMDDGVPRGSTRNRAQVMTELTVIYRLLDEADAD